MSERCVLLVEDSPAAATLAKYALAAGGVRVEHCATLGAALARLADPECPRPSAVVLDLTLPDSSGVETYDRLAAAGPPPVVVLSGDDDPAQALALIERGAQDYLVKGENSGPAIARSVRQAIERSRLQEAERRAREVAEASVRAQRAFVAAMSHEVRTPLNAILGMSELLAQTPLAPDQREYVEIARRCGRSLQGLLDNALELSRLESGRAELPHEPFDLEAVVQECLEVFAFAAHQKGLALVADLRDEQIGIAVGDEARLRQLLFNLVGNAVKFTERGRVAVSVRSRGDGLAIEVADTGIGISRDRQAAIFERFVQAESGTTRRFGGSGLGLALCREMVAVLGGRIDVESTPGAGSVFRVELPWPVEPIARSAALAGRRILALLADPVERASLAARLRLREAIVREAGSIAEAEHLLAAERFDAWLLDARPPEGGGIDLLQRNIAEHASAHRVVLLPLVHRLGELARCEALGAVALCKPARWSALERALAEVAASPAAAAARATAPPRFAGHRILLVEDAPENRVIAQAHLRSAGCEVELAFDGEQAVERWRGGDFDLVLMDVHMPGIDGCEATRRIRGEERRSGRRAVPIVAITADTQEDQRTACFGAGCDAYLGKPFTQDDLFGVLERYLPSAPASSPPETVDEPRAQIPPEIADLAEQYLRNRCADAETLRAAAGSGDFAEARRRGHNMKGSGTGYGFRHVSQLGARIERAAEARDAAELRRCADALSAYAEKELVALD